MVRTKIVDLTLFCGIRSCKEPFKFDVLVVAGGWEDASMYFPRRVDEDSNT